MDSNTKGFTSYWRNTLADADSGKGGFRSGDADKFCQWRDAESGRLAEDIVRDYFAGEDTDVMTVEVMLRPQAWMLQRQHGKKPAAGAPDVVTPLVLSARLNREGFLIPAADASIPRDLLEPLPQGVFSVGEMAQYDKYQTTHSSDYSADEGQTPPETETEQQQLQRHAGYQRQWQAYLQQSEQLLAHVAGKWLDAHEHYEQAEYGYVIKESQAAGAGFHILGLYDHLLKSKKEVPLLSRFAATEPSPSEPLLGDNAQFARRLGHSGDKFPLAMAQRDALSHYLTQQTGDILAVNGPPGTGKTTLVLSIIATEWANAALNQSEPPIVIATSTNNQAVTNIIEAFGKDFGTGSGAMAGRWLPGLQSYGAYFPSSRGKAEAAKKYQTEDFFNSVESKVYTETAQAYYLQKARAAFPQEKCESAGQVTELLHQQLTGLSERLQSVGQQWQLLQQARQQLMAVSENPQHYIADKQQLLLQSSRETEQFILSRKKWQEYRASESMIFTLFGWLPSIRTRRGYQIKLLLDEILGDRMAGFQGKLPEGVDAYIDSLIVQSQNLQQQYQQQIDHAEQAIAEEQAAVRNWQEICQTLGHTGEQELNLAQADELADLKIRFPAFLLATHYWEGRWLQDMADIDNPAKEKTRTGAKSVQARWQRRMKLTPCVVMTCYMLPNHMKTSEFAGQGLPFDKSYFYNLADLLIVDEAGQVLPEVAAASFALAKKALIIGDTEQIAPIWSSTPAIDIGNMLEAGILQGDTQEHLAEAYRRAGDSGKSSASGSVMKIAQFASRYHYDPDLARGMYLYEHRRCFDNIIGYCNELSYHGKLQPKRGTQKETLFPAMGYLHIDGLCQQATSGSRYNSFEAEIIAAWLSENQQGIEDYYGKPIHSLVGVVTPFAAQVTAIKSALAARGITVDGGESSLTVGTVHSLQGAERAIVLFSPVYSKHDDGGFIDSSNSMLNVAVSRAKDSFLVFGDMDLFEIQPPSSPRGLLAKYLFAVAGNALVFEFPERQDLIDDHTPVTTLHGVEQHDEFLHDSFAGVTRSILIVSPWLRWRRLEQTGFLESMIRAIARGVSVTVVTDESFNTEDDDEVKYREKQQRLTEALNRLNEQGIVTRLVDRVHSKIVVGDDAMLCIGSFNWFSAAREEKYQRYDTSMVYRGEGAKGEIKTIHASLTQRLK
ncbi:AAA domain-containing protein [Tatumella sp. UBA2305]|uniref:AAA domain-containing protein n=1 Tax=Tatumella sp. UBA2305 TaxID=1947647 RepID=UPI0025FA9ED6|nr:AAA domain-containing protein [Tatumella sp. UBA2305]